MDWEGVRISPEWMAVSIPRCFDGPEAYSMESELGRYLRSGQNWILY